MFFPRRSARLTTLPDVVHEGRSTLVFMSSGFEIHTGERCAQVWAVGGVRAVSVMPGDPVRHLAWDSARGGRDFAVEPLGSFQVLMPEGGYVIVEDSVFRGWVDDEIAGLGVVDNLGHPVADVVSDAYFYRNREHYSVQLAKAVLGEEDADDRSLNALYGVVDLRDLRGSEACRRRKFVRESAMSAIARLEGRSHGCRACAELRVGLRRYSDYCGIA